MIGAFSYLEQATSLKGSLYDTEKAKMVNFFQTDAEIEKQNMSLQMLNEEITQQKEEIEALNNQLEKLVEDRTNQLKMTVDNLSKQNQDLAQFSYIISHNLRAPVARILGLINIFNEEKYADEADKQIISHLKRTAQELDTVIKDLIQIISIRNSLDKTKGKAKFYLITTSLVSTSISKVLAGGSTKSNFFPFLR